MSDARFEPQAPRPGQQIPPEVTLLSEVGKPVQLAELLREGPLVLLFFGGSADAQGVQRLLEFRDRTLAFQQFKTRIAAVSTDGPSLSSFLRSERGLGFPILSDEHGKVSAAFGMLEGSHARSAGFLIDKTQVVRRRWLANQLSSGDLLTAVKRGAGKPEKRNSGAASASSPKKTSRLRRRLGALFTSLQHAIKPVPLVR